MKADKPLAGLLAKSTRPTRDLNILFCIFILGCIWAWNSIGLDLGTLVRESDSLAGLVERLTPPTFIGIEKILELTLETVYMAVVGTTIGCLIAVPLAFLSSQHNSVVLTRYMAGLVISFFRSVPELVVALIAVVLFGVGQAAGVIALAYTSVGMIGRLTGTAIDQLPRDAEIAVRTTGATGLQIILGVKIPLLWPQLLGVLLYRLDINLRASTMLGVVGAGGIGLLLRTTMGNLDYQAALGVILVIAGFVLLTELASILLRKLVLNPPEDRQLRPANLTAVTKPITRNQLLSFSMFTGFFALLLLSATNVIQASLDSDWNSDNFSKVLGGLIAPNFLDNSEQIFGGFLETLAIAILATLLGGILGTVVGVISVREITGSWSGYLIARAFLIFKRAFPTVVLAVLLVVAFGLGPSAGVVALSIGTGGILAKLITDSLEEIDRRPIQALEAIGANRWQRFASGWLPQVLPTLVGHLIYSFDINIRYSAVLGVIGAGGIGFVLLTALREYNYPAASAVICLVFVSILTLELISNLIRKRIS